MGYCFELSPRQPPLSANRCLPSLVFALSPQYHTSSHGLHIHHVSPRSLSPRTTASRVLKLPCPHVVESPWKSRTAVRRVTKIVRWKSASSYHEPSTVGLSRDKDAVALEMRVRRKWQVRPKLCHKMNFFHKLLHNSTQLTHVCFHGAFNVVSCWGR